MNFDVLVWNSNLQFWATYKSGLSKREAKRLIKELRSKGKKAQLKTTIGERSELDSCDDLLYDESDDLMTSNK